MIDLSKQFAVGKEAAESIRISGKFDRVIFCGMGGSIIPAEMASMLWLDGLNGYIHRGFGLPHWAGKNCLVICVSWSGNTEETISSFQAAIKNGLAAVVITKGGQLAELAQSNQIPVVILPSENVPSRLGVGYMLAALLTTLSGSAIIDYSLPVHQTWWSGLPTRINLTSTEVGKDLSGKIRRKAPLIYSSYPWRYVARFWKTSFNENSKVHSFSSYFPEAAHNELAAFQPTKKDSYFPIVIADPDEESDDSTKLQRFVSFLKEKEIDHAVVALTGDNRLEKILNSYNLAISTSVELARLLGVDPFDNSTIEEFKKD